jgi:DNA primase
MAGYSPALLDEIRAAVDIVDLVGRFVSLKKAGVNWKGLCPFHGEKTPSFMVNPRKGIYHCFGCGVGGDAFGFLMRQDKLAFPEAVRALAKTAGIALPEDGATRGGDSGREELLRVMDLAARFYADALWAPGGARAREYLERRGVDPQVARRFGLGYAPDGWDALLTFMRSERVAADILEKAGLVLTRQTGSGFYDRFRGRLIFAIRDLQGRPVAFGGRAFGDEQPKYLNSPETPLYSKGQLLYAADQARPTIQEKNRALLVEGYVDCLMAHQYGFTETVAALGTAFTGAQLGLLRRYCEEVVTFFDADAAGQKAAERAEELLESTSYGGAWDVNRTGAFVASGALRMKVALLPPGHDPDTFLRHEGAAAFAERITTARGLLSYALDRVLADGPGPMVPGRGPANAFARAALMLAKVPDAQEAASLSHEAGRKLGVDPTQLWTESRKLAAALSRPVPGARPAVTTTGPPSMERDLVTLLLHSPAAREALLPFLDDSDISHAALHAIVAALRLRPAATAEGLMTDLDDESARSVLAALLVEERPLDDVGASIAEFQRRLERRQKLRRMRELSRSIAEAQAAEGVDAPIQDALHRLNRESKEVYALSRAVAVSDHTAPTGREAPTGRQAPAGPQGVQTYE